MSHDARLILETNCELWECSDRTLHKFNGDFLDYREAVLQSIESPEGTVIEGRKVVTE